MSITYSDEPLSISNVARLFQKYGYDIKRETLVNGLVTDGLLLDGSTISEKGLSYGISLRFGEQSGAWPVYNKQCQEYIEQRIPQYKNLPNIMDTLPLSLTKLSSKLKEAGFKKADYALLLELCIEDGLLLDDKTITEKGSQYGIRLRREYPVYDQKAQEYIIQLRIFKTHERDAWAKGSNNH